MEWSVTSRYHGSKFLDHNNWELRQRRRRRQRELEKSNRFISEKQQLCTCIRLFCTFFSRRCTTATWNFLISRTRFTKYANTTQKFPFPFSKLTDDPFWFNRRNFRRDLTNYMKLNKIVKVWNSANSLLINFKCCFQFVVIQKFCYHGNVT